MTLGNEEVNLLASSLQDYLYLLHLDLSSNMLEGPRGGTVVSRILSRKCYLRGGQDIEYLNLANNKLGSGGFAAITQQLIVNNYENLTLNVAYNGIEEIHLLVAFNANADLIFDVTNLNLEGNVIRPRYFYKLATLLSHATMLTRLNLNKCKLGDEGLQITFSALEGLRKLTKIDYSNNNIFDHGISKIGLFLGRNVKSILRSIKFNQNQISDQGLTNLLQSIEKKHNCIMELSFIEN